MWTVVGLVVVLLAAGVTYLLLRDDGDGGDPRGGGGDPGQGGGCSGEYCVGGYSYVNACGVFDPSSVASLIGSTGTGRLFVKETYADPLPPVDPAARGAWTYGVRSNCYISPEDREGAVFRSVSLELKQTADEAAELAGEGRPLEGAPDAPEAVVEDSEGNARVYWRYRNVSATLDLSWDSRRADISDDTMAQAVAAITKGLANPPGEPRGLGDLSEGGKRVVTDACTVFTGDDFQSATRYVVNPTNVSRTYSNLVNSPLSTKCRRFTAPANAGFPAPDGTTFLDGAMAPTVTVSKLADAAAAQAELDGNRERIAEAVDLPGIGDKAVFGIGSASAFTLQFTAGFHLVTVDCGLSNGNADWTAADMRSRLEPLAAAIAARMG